MLYRTIILELLQANPTLHETLRRGRMMLSVTESLATALRARHEAMKGELSATRTGMDPNQISCAAMEIAVKELENRLQAVFPPDGRRELSLDDAMAFVRILTSIA